MTGSDSADDSADNLKLVIVLIIKVSHDCYNLIGSAGFQVELKKVVQRLLTLPFPHAIMSWSMLGKNQGSSLLDYRSLVWTANPTAQLVMVPGLLWGWGPD